MPQLKVTAMMGSWTGDRRSNRQKKVERKLKTLVVTDPVFFVKRDKRGLPRKDKPHDYSEEMIKAATEQFESIVIFCSAKNNPAQVVTFLKSLNFPVALTASQVLPLPVPQFRVISYEQKDLESITSFWKETLLELGATFKRVRNPREITYLTLDRYMVADHITWVGPDDHFKIKIELEKDKTFQELQAERRKRAEW